MTSALPALAGSQRKLSVEPQASAAIELSTTDAWYDYVLVDSAGGSWRRELAGHVEGQASRTLPT